MRPNAWIIVIGLAAAGCGQDATSTLSFEEPLRVSVDGPAQGAITVRLPPDLRVTLEGPRALEDFTPVAQQGELTVPISSARMSLVAHENGMMLERIELPLGDLQIAGGALPASGVRLRELVLALEGREPATMVRREPSLLSMRGEVAMELRWKLVLDDGSLYALGPLALPKVELHAAATRDGNGVVRVEIMMLCPGVCAEIPAVFQVRDAALDLTATGAASPL
jgi:hypothetical protein